MSERNVSRALDVSLKPSHCQSQHNKLCAPDSERLMTPTEPVPRIEVSHPSGASSQSRNASSNIALSSIFPGGSVSLVNGYTPDASLVPRVQLKRLSLCRNGEPSQKTLREANVVSTSEDDSVAAVASVSHNGTVNDDLAARVSECQADNLRHSRRVKSHLMQRQRLAKDFILELDDSHGEDDCNEPEQVSIVRAKGSAARDGDAAGDVSRTRSISKTSKVYRKLVNVAARPKGTTSACKDKARLPRRPSKKPHLTGVQPHALLQHDDSLHANPLNPPPAESSLLDGSLGSDKTQQAKETLQQSTCNYPWCLLGCVCKSLKNSAASRKRRHCGRVECMLSCCCESLSGRVQTRLRTRLRHSPIGPGPGYRMNSQTGSSAARTRGTPDVWIPHWQIKKTTLSSVSDLFPDGQPMGMFSWPSCATRKNRGTSGIDQLTAGEAELQSESRSRSTAVHAATFTTADRMSVAGGCKQVNQATHAKAITASISDEDDDVLVVDEDVDEQSHRPSNRAGSFVDSASSSSSNVHRWLAVAPIKANVPSDSLLLQLQQDRIQLRRQQEVDCSHPEAVSSIAANHPRLNWLLSNPAEARGRVSGLQPILPKVPGPSQQEQPLTIEVGKQQDGPNSGPTVEEHVLPLLNSSLSTVADRGSSSAGVPRKAGAKSTSTSRHPGGKHKARDEDARETYDQLTVAVEELGNKPPLAVPGSTITTLLVFRRCSQPDSSPPMQLKVISANTRWESNLQVRQNILSVASQLADDEPEEVHKLTFQDYLMYIYPKNRISRITGGGLSPGALSKEPRYMVLIMQHRPLPPPLLGLPPSAFERQYSVPHRRPLGRFRDPEGNWIPWSRQASPASCKQASVGPKPSSSAAVANVQLPHASIATCSGTQIRSTGNSAATMPSQGRIQFSSSQALGSVATYTIPSAQGATRPLLFTTPEQTGNAGTTACNRIVSDIQIHPPGLKAVRSQKSALPEPATSHTSQTTSRTDTTLPMKPGASHMKVWRWASTVPPADGIASSSTQSQDLNDQLRQALMPDASTPAVAAPAVAHSHPGTPASNRGYDLEADCANKSTILRSTDPPAQPYRPVSPSSRRVSEGITTTAKSPAACSSGMPVQTRSPDEDNSTTISSPQLPSPRSSAKHNLFVSPRPINVQPELTPHDRIVAASMLEESSLEDSCPGSLTGARSPLCARDADPSPVDGIGSSGEAEVGITERRSPFPPTLAPGSVADVAAPQPLQPSVTAQQTSNCRNVQGPAPELGLVELSQVAWQTGGADPFFSDVELNRSNADRLPTVKFEPVETTQCEDRMLRGKMPADQQLLVADTSNVASATGGTQVYLGDVELDSSNGTRLSSAKVEPVESDPCADQVPLARVPADQVLHNFVQQPPMFAGTHQKVIKKEPGEVGWSMHTVPPSSAVNAVSTGTLDAAMGHPDMVEPGVLMTIDIEDNQSIKSDVSEDYWEFEELDKSSLVDGEPSDASSKSIPVASQFTGMVDIGWHHVTWHHQQNTRPDKASLNDTSSLVETGTNQPVLVRASNSSRKPAGRSGYIAYAPEKSVCIMSTHTVASDSITDDGSIGHPSQSEQAIHFYGSVLSSSQETSCIDDSRHLAGPESIAQKFYTFEDHDDFFGTVPNTASAITTDVGTSCNGDLLVYQQNIEGGDYNGDHNTSWTSDSSPPDAEDGGSRSTQPPRAYSPASIGWLGYGNVEMSKSSSESEAAEGLVEQSSAYGHMSGSDADDLVDVERVDLDERPAGLQNSPSIGFQNSPPQLLSNGHGNLNSSSAHQTSYPQTTGNGAQHRPIKIKDREAIAYHNTKEKNRRHSLSQAISQLCEAVDLPRSSNPSIAHILVSARNFIHKLKLSEIHNRTEKEMLAAQGEQLRSDLMRLRQKVGHHHHGASTS